MPSQDPPHAGDYGSFRIIYASVRGGQLIDGYGYAREFRRAAPA